MAREGIDETRSMIYLGTVRRYPGSSVGILDGSPYPVLSERRIEREASGEAEVRALLMDVLP